MMKKLIAAGLFLIINFFQVYSQIITADPFFPTVNDEIIITFDASQGNKGLMGFTGDVYAHTGVITSESTTPSDWKHAPSKWGDNSQKYKLSRVQGDIYQLVISPSIHEYYGILPGEVVKQLAFVFRSADTYKEGKTSDGGDIFYQVYEPGLNIILVTPDRSPVMVGPGELIGIEAHAIESDSIILMVDDSIHTQVAGSSLQVNIVAKQEGKHWIMVVAGNSASKEVADSVYYFIKDKVLFSSLPAGAKDGITYLSDTSVMLVLFAPEKKSVYAIGDFTNWELDNKYMMKLTPDLQRFWTTIEGLEKGKEYIFQYLVDDSILIGDPYAEQISDPWNDKWITEETYPGLIPYPDGKTSWTATVLKTGEEEYTWTTENFTPPEKKDLIIYELLIRDFTREHTFQSVIDTLPYLEKLGINAIELMPVSEFEGNLSWGYNPSYYFAVDKYYGPKNDFKKLIDTCHSRGIAVIMDMVLNHSFGQSPLVKLYWDAANNRPLPWNRWFNPVAKHDFNVGYDFNHESAQTKIFCRRVLRFWLEEYRVDGFRFDLSKGFTQKNTLGDMAAMGAYDASRIAIWKDYADTIWSINPNAYVILEHFAANNEEKELADHGMMLWGNMNWDYSNAAKGASSSLAWGTSQARGWEKPHLVTYMESHDEERLMVRVLKDGLAVQDYNTRNRSVAQERMELAAVFFLTIPGPKMIWQFGELGYDISIEYNGRLGQKPPAWPYFWDTDPKHIYQVYQFLSELRRQEEAFSTEDYTYSLSASLKSLHLNHQEMNVTVLGNFGVIAGSIDPAFQQAGRWYEFFTGDSIEVSDIHNQISLEAGEYRLYTDRRLTTPEFILDVPVAYDPEAIPSVEISPNPVSELIFAEINSLHQDRFSLIILDITGREIRQAAAGMINSGTATVDCDLSGLKPGIYFLKAIIGDQTIVKKIMKQ